MVFIRDMCRTVKYERPTSNFHLELLSFSDFFNAGNDHYLCFREFVMSYILNHGDIHSVKKFYCEDLFFIAKTCFLRLVFAKTCFFKTE